MKLIRELDALPQDMQGGAVTIGNFDGVHRGHAALIAALRLAAREIGGPSVVFTFEPHPVRLLRPHEAPPPLTWIERKAELLAELGVDFVVACPTTRALLSLGAREFFQQVVVERLRAAAMLEGPNFHFGKGREGNVETLQALCAEAGVTMQIAEPIRSSDGDYVSSSRIRDCLRRGDVAAARSMLGRPYRIRGMVTHGAGRGAGIGFPTANLDGIDTLTPAHGVYAAMTRVTGKAYAVAVNVGPNPTFGEEACKVECHLTDYQGSLYGQVLEVDFLAHLRSIRTFSNVDELKLQLKQDVAAARSALQ